jgi:group I intron endonuclease
MEKIVCIYQIVNKHNGKMYIGQTWDYKKRTREHIRNLNKNTHINKHLQASWNKYGYEAFYFGIVEKFDESVLQSDIDKSEYEYINIMDYCDQANGYNNKTGGNGSKHTEAAKMKMSIAAKNRPESHKYCMKGIPRSPEVIAKISASKMGHVSTLKGKPWPENRRLAHERNRKTTN